MPVQTLKLGGKRFVILPESEYRKLKAKPVGGKKNLGLRRKPSIARDAGDLAEHHRRLAEPGEVSLEQVRRRLGL
jgi:hypothetical protein